MSKKTIEQYQRIGVQDIRENLERVDPTFYTEENPLSILTSVSLFSVRLVATPCNYGGYRWWFICPKTHKKCLDLYLSPSDGMLYSREALNLSYASQNKSRITRIIGWVYRERTTERALLSKG